MKPRRITIYIIDTDLNKIITRKRILNVDFIDTHLKKLYNQYSNNKNITFKISS